MKKIPGGSVIIKSSCRHLRTDSSLWHIYSHCPELTKKRFYVVLYRNSLDLEIYAALIKVRELSCLCVLAIWSRVNWKVIDESTSLQT